MIDAAVQIISRLGGPTVVARRLGIGRQAVSNWRIPTSRGGTGGIPRHRYDDLIALAAERGITLTYEDFVRAPDPAVAESADA